MGRKYKQWYLYDRVEEKRGSLSKKELETAEYMTTSGTANLFIYNGSGRESRKQ